MERQTRLGRLAAGWRRAIATLFALAVAAAPIAALAQAGGGGPGGPPPSGGGGGRGGVAWIVVILAIAVAIWLFTRRRGHTHT